LRLLEGRALTACAAIALDGGLGGDAEAFALEGLAVHRETGHETGATRALSVLEQARNLVKRGQRG
jgi:hypothetical protein